MPLDDEAAEKLLEGRKLADLGDLAELLPVIDDIRSLGHGPVPPPSPTLTRMLIMGAPDDASTTHSFDRTGKRGRLAAAKVPWAAVAAALVLAVAAALNVLPKPAQRMVAAAISAVTPFELPGGTPHENSLEDKPGAAAGRAPRVTKTPPVGRPADVRGPVSTRPTGLGRRGAASPPSTTPEPDGRQIKPGPTVPPTSAPVPSSAVRSSPRASLPVTTVPVTPVPVVTNPPSSPQPSGVVSGPDRRSATLTGASVLPGPGDPDGTGTASIELSAEKGELCSTLALSAGAPPTAVHLHQAPHGQIGPVVLELPPPAEIGQQAAVCVSAPSDLLRKLREEPGGYYLEVHTREFSEGALRGQLSM